MTATEHLAKIKARAEAAAEHRRSSLSPVLISQTQWDRERLLAALEAVLAEHEPMAVAMTEACSACTGIEGLVAYPCPTVTVINEALGEETQ